MENFNEIMKFVMKMISTFFFVSIIGFIVAIFKSYKSSRVNIPLLYKLAVLTYPKHFDKFETYFELYLNDKENFISKYLFVLNDYNIDHSKSLTPIEILFVFGVSINAVYVYDTQNETDKFEPENFIENLLSENVNWITAPKWREMNRHDNRSTIDFQRNLLQTIDNDIQLIHKKILFFNIHTDNYISDYSSIVFTIVDESGFSEIMELEPNIFHGI